MTTTTTLELRSVTDIIPYARNARVHSNEQILQLRSSLREFGFVAPLLIDASGNLIAGHGRLEAAKAEGMTKVPCVLVEHLSDTQRRAYILADNRLAEQAQWDADLLSLELQELQEAGLDISLTGFDEEFILTESDDVQEDEHSVPDTPDEPKSKRGDLYRLGRHRLLCGDATIAEDVKTLLHGEKAHLLLTDPPYNVNISGGTDAHLSIDNDNMSEDAYQAFLENALQNAVGVMEPGSGFYLWHADGDPGRSVRNACHSVGLPVRQCLIWVKQRATLGRQDYQWQHEPCLHGQVGEEALECGENWDSHESCLYGWKDGKPHLWCSDRKQTTVLEYDKPTRSLEHPTMKPVRLFAYQIANSTLQDANVFDPFAGSGTTLIACEQLGRTAFLMESDPRYVDVIVQRWETFIGEQAVLMRDD